jgi:hypothetical protein
VIFCLVFFGTAAQAQAPVPCTAPDVKLDNCKVKIEKAKKKDDAEGFVIRVDFDFEVTWNGCGSGPCFGRELITGVTYFRKARAGAGETADVEIDSDAPGFSREVEQSQNRDVTKGKGHEFSDPNADLKAGDVVYAKIDMDAKGCCGRRAPQGPCNGCQVGCAANGKCETDMVTVK